MSNESINYCVTDDYKLETSYKNGLKHGIEIYSDEFGVIETPFYEGKIHGYVKQYEKNENEVDCVKIPYVHGKIHGIVENEYAYRQIYINNVEILRVFEKSRMHLSDFNCGNTIDICAICLAICKIFIDIEVCYKSLGDNANYIVKKISSIIPDNIHRKDFYNLIVPDNMKIDTIWSEDMVERILGCGNIGVDSISKLITQQIIREVSDNKKILTLAEMLSVTARLIQSCDLEYVKSYITKNYDIFNDDLINHNDISDENIPLIALQLFLESKSFENAISNVIDSNIKEPAILFIVGKLADIHYGVPKNLYNQALKYLNDGIIKIYKTLNKNSN